MKNTNEYAQRIHASMYEKMPKTVLAALVVSLFDRLEVREDGELNTAIYAEWKALNQNGIIPQKPKF